MYIIDDKHIKLTRVGQDADVISNKGADIKYSDYKP